MLSTSELSQVMQVMETTSYDRLKTLNGNRPISQKRVLKLKRSIQTRGNKRVIFVGKYNRSLYVIDGQHYKDACVMLEIPVFYQVQEYANIEEMIDMMAVLNNTSATWELIDYVHAYSQLKIIDYMRLEAWKERTGFSIQNLGRMATGGEITQVSPEIKNKQFRFRLSEEQMTTMVEMVETIIEIINPINYTMVNTIVRGFVKYKRMKGQDFSFDFVVNKVRSSLGRIHDLLSDETFFEFLMD